MERGPEKREKLIGENRPEPALACETNNPES
jgi:hypothetical protein